MIISDIPTYIIGMNEPNEKIKYLQENGINVTWFKGIKGETVSEKTIDKYINPQWKTFGPKSAIGCAISHIKLWELAKKNSNEYTLILEDDVLLHPDFDKYIKETLNNLPKDLDLLYLGGVGAYDTNLVNIIWGVINDNITENIEAVNKYIKKPVNLMATHAYIISLKGAEKLIKLLKNNIDNHIDVCINRLHLKEQIKNYIVYPELIYQTSTFNISKSNSTVNFPIIFNKIFSKIYIDRYVTLDFGLNINFLRLG